MRPHLLLAALLLLAAAPASADDAAARSLIRGAWSCEWHLRDFGAGATATTRVEYLADGRSVGTAVMTLPLPEGTISLTALAAGLWTVENGRLVEVTTEYTFASMSRDGVETMWPDVDPAVRAEFERATEAIIGVETPSVIVTLTPLAMSLRDVATGNLAGCRRI